MKKFMKLLQDFMLLIVLGMGIAPVMGMNEERDVEDVVDVLAGENIEAGEQALKPQAPPLPSSRPPALPEENVLKPKPAELPAEAEAPKEGPALEDVAPAEAAAANEAIANADQAAQVAGKQADDARNAVDKLQ